jgi:hypothetical protein
VSSLASAIGFVEARSRAPRVHVTDISGKGLHLHALVVFPMQLNGKPTLAMGRVVALSPTLVTILEEEGSGFRIKRFPTQVSRID